MSFLFSLALKAAKRLAIEAVISADHAKSSSFTEARHTPPMTGMRQSHLACESFLPYRSVPMTAAKAGSAALTIMAKETAPADCANTENECAAAAQNPTGIILITSSMVTDGVERRSGANQAKRA